MAFLRYLQFYVICDLLEAINQLLIVFYFFSNSSDVMCESGVDNYFSHYVDLPFNIYYGISHYPFEDASSWGLGRAAVCECGTPWTFLLPFLLQL